MKVVVLEDYGRFEDRSLEVPSEGGVLIRVAACGICGSDLSVYKGTPAMRARWKPPLILGHEIAGIVTDGPEKWLGQAVTVNPLVPCGQCDQCRSGYSNLCINRTNIGFHYSGGFAEQIRVPLAQLYALPQGMPLWKGALAEPLAVAVRAVELAGMVSGHRVLVLGGGAIGTLVAWVLARMGATVSVTEHNPLRRTWLRSLGFIAEVLQTSTAEYHAVIDTVGAKDTPALAVSIVKPGGTVVLVGLGDVEVPLPLQRVVLQEITLRGSYVFTHADFARATQILLELPDELAIQRPFTQAQGAFDDLLSGKLAASKVVLVHGG